MTSYEATRANLWGQISRSRAEMINGPRMSHIGPKLTEMWASKVESPRGFRGRRRRPEPEAVPRGVDEARVAERDGDGARGPDARPVVGKRGVARLA